jgi:hypothetical protein
VALFHLVDDVIQRQGAQVLCSGQQGGATHAGAERIGDREVEPVACEDAVLQAQGDRQIVGGTKVNDVQTSQSASGHGASLPERGVRRRGDGRWPGMAPDVSGINAPLLTYQRSLLTPVTLPLSGL